MKPRYRPGKPATNGRKSRKTLAKSKPLSEEQMRHLQSEAPTDSMGPKAGRGGARAEWDIDYAEGCDFDQKEMPCKEPENISKDGVRRFPRNRR